MLFIEFVKKLKNNVDAQKQFEDSANSVGIKIKFKDYLPLLEEYVDGNKTTGKMDMMLNIIEERIRKGESVMDLLGIDKISKKQFAEVFTPTWLVDDMLDKLPVDVWSNPDFTWIDNSCGSGVFLWHGVVKRLKVGLKDKFKTEKELNKHIATMIHGVDIQASNVGICRKYLVESLGDENRKTIINNIVKSNSLEFDYWGGKKFNVVVGNPPYQDDSGNKGKGHTLWTRFVEMAFDRILIDGGYLVYVHPSLWRQVDHEIGDILKNKNMLYLEIHNEADGIKTFGANTRYDWYVVQNSVNKNKTTVKGQDGVVSDIRLGGWTFVPNMMFNIIENLLAGGNNICEVLHSESNYEPRRDWMSKEKTNKFKYPCVYSINMAGEVTYMWSSRTDKGHFGYSKFIFQHGFNTGCVVDQDGEYGLTQWCSAIVDTMDNLPKIKKAFTSDAFQKVIMATSLKREINWKVISLFRKDFWKDFIDDA